MRLIATLDEKYHAHILAGLWCSQFVKPKTVHFVIDSGCTTTTILSDDVTRLGINCSSLGMCSDPITTANGQIVPFVLPNVSLIFHTHYGWFNRKNKFRSFDMGDIHCHAPTDPTLMTQRKIANALSLLGMDFLKNFKSWKFRNNKLYLDI